jgi:hypothetical protein
MLNLEETLSFSADYVIQRDFYIKGFLYSLSALVFAKILRSQVPEINLLQLVPGFYLLLLFLLLIFMVIISDIFNRIPLEIEMRKEYGTKTFYKGKMLKFVQISFLYLFSILFPLLNFVIPLSLDSFATYSEDSLDNLWSYDELINVEIILVGILIILSQYPSFSLFSLTSEADIIRLPEIWRLLTLFSFIFAGVLTPTVDGYTQFSFAFSSVVLYLIIIETSEKRVTTKFTGMTTSSS